eukprot:GEMP01013810.1.p1 GENE.GEMP01013810.1~~GEMP01013810.1.p1  ORF type:complete len:488 (+),score=101.92 GEMP01013810.1:165-1628(+)
MTSKPSPAPIQDMMSHPANQNPDSLMDQQAGSPAYHVLLENNMLTNTYRLMNVKSIPTLPSNSTPLRNAILKCGCFCCACLCSTPFEVPDGYMRPAEDGKGAFLFYGSGVHNVCSPFVRIHEKNIPYTDKAILHGNLALVTIDQGFIGYAMDRGQPVLLPPGIHFWESDTLRFENAIDLSQNVITLGPYTLVTVDEGYSAVAQNNGKQHILSGGQVHLLTHRNWKFEKFMSEKIQTDGLGLIVATTADNVLLETVATVNWRITDVIMAARMAAQTMKADGSSVRGEDIVKLRSDVLKQATASLAAFIGSVRYSDSFHVSAMNVGTDNSKMIAREPEPADLDIGNSPLFNFARLNYAVAHCNEVCNKYGVMVMSINIISAKPRDDKLMNQLAAGAVAAAAAEQAETAARGNAKAKLIVASAQADAERICAQGSKDAASILEKSDFAVELARMSKAGDAIKDKTTFFFGGHPQQLPALLANPSILNVKH